jgi:hypothetical protein
MHIGIIQDIPIEYSSTHASIDKDNLLLILTILTTTDEDTRREIHIEYRVHITRWLDKGHKE